MAQGQHDDYLCGSEWAVQAPFLAKGPQDPPVMSK